MNAVPKISNRILALLAKAESTTFEEEAHALIAKAQELASKYSIDAALLDAASRVQTEPSQIMIVLERPYWRSKGLLLCEIASANNCRCVWTRERIVVFGFEVDLNNVELMFTSLLVYASSSMIRHGSVQNEWGETVTRSFRKAFLDGFAMRIGERLQEANTQVVSERKDLGEDLLPVLASRAEKIDAAVDVAFPKLGTMTSRVGSNFEGFMAGRASANSANVGVRSQISA